MTTATAWGGTCEIVKLKNGDKRRRDELAERARRVHILGRYGLIRAKDARGHGLAHGDDAGRGAGGPRQQKGGTRGEEEYDDDEFEGEASIHDDARGCSNPHSCFVGPVKIQFGVSFRAGGWNGLGPLLSF